MSASPGRAWRWARLAGIAVLSFVATALLFTVGELALRAFR